VTANLAKADRAKLAKLLGLLGSTHAGERDAAALASQRFLEQRGLTWRAVLEPPAVEHQQPQMGIWRQTCARCLEHRASLRAWEANFLTDLPKFRRLSTKQRYCLQTIADRVVGGAKN
jgi:hypothetical protein